MAITRRLFTTGAIASALTVANRAKAQAPGRVYRIALWDISLPVTDLEEASRDPRYRAFFAELRRLGFVEGQNLKVDRYSSEGRPPGSYPEIAQTIVNLRPDVVFANGSVASERVMEFTRTIPIVCPGLPDPVAIGLAVSLARPGGNLTGLMLSGGFEFLGRQLQLLRELTPAMTRLRYLSSTIVWPQQGALVEAILRQATSEAGIALAIDVMDGPYDDPGYRTVFDRIASNRDDSLIVSAVTAHIANTDRIVRLAAERRIPVLYAYQGAVVRGGLITYASDIVDRYRRGAGYVARILNGDDPAVMPIEVPSKFNLALNTRTAKALALQIPPRILAIADEVLE